MPSKSQGLDKIGFLVAWYFKRVIWKQCIGILSRHIATNVPFDAETAKKRWSKRTQEGERSFRKVHEDQLSLEKSCLNPAIKEVEKGSDIALLLAYGGTQDSHAEDLSF